jgi:hypothetical protein
MALAPGPRLPDAKALAIYRMPIYDTAAVRSFRDAEAEKIFQQQGSRQFHLNQPKSLRDLAAIPGHRLEALNPKTAVEPQLAGHSLSAASICGNDSYRPLGELRSSSKAGPVPDWASTAVTNRRF